MIVEGEGFRISFTGTGLDCWCLVVEHPMGQVLIGVLLSAVATRKS